MEKHAELPSLDHIVLGTMTFGESVNGEAAEEIINSALSLGITRIDTANVYSQGKAEKILGELPTQRRAVKIATKVGMPHADAGDHAPLSRQGIRKCVEGSLERLQQSSVDLLYLHQPDRTTPLPETLETMKELMDEGIIGAYGLSNFPVDDAAAVAKIAAKLGLQSPSVSQQMYNMVARKLEEDYLQFVAQQQHELMVYNPLAGGLLTGRYRSGAADEEGNRFTTSALAEMYRQRYWKPSLLEAVDALYGIASSQDMSLIELSLRWVRAQVPQASVLVGVSNVTQLEGNVQHLTANPLSPEIVSQCSQITANIFDDMPDFRR